MGDYQTLSLIVLIKIVQRDLPLILISLPKDFTYSESKRLISKPGASDADAKAWRDGPHSFTIGTYSTMKTPTAISDISCSDRIIKIKASANDYKKCDGDCRSVTKYGYKAQATPVAVPERSLSETDLIFYKTLLIVSFSSRSSEVGAFVTCQGRGLCAMCDVQTLERLECFLDGSYRLSV